MRVMSMDGNELQGYAFSIMDPRFFSAFAFLSHRRLVVLWFFGSCLQFHRMVAFCVSSGFSSARLRL